MSSNEDSEEDELQMILEGRDVEYEDNDDNASDGHKSDSEEGNQSMNEEFEDIEDIEEIIRHKETKITRSTEIRHSVKVKTIQRKRRIVDDFEEAIEDNRYDKEVVSRERHVSNDSNQQNTENVDKVKVKVRRIVTNRLPILNADKLMTVSGISSLPQVFADIKFGGKGSELKDLNQVLFRLSHWSHRLYPSLTFDDFLERCEQLGHKRLLKNFLSKIRLDMPLNNDEEDRDVDRDEKDEDMNPNRDFDAIIGKTFGDINESNKNTETQAIDEMDSDLDDIDIDVQNILQNSNEEQLEETNEINLQITEDLDNNEEVFNTKITQGSDVTSDNEDMNENKDNHVMSEKTTQESDVIRDEDINEEVVNTKTTEVSDEDMSEDEVLREINSNDC